MTQLIKKRTSAHFNLASSGDVYCFHAYILDHSQWKKLLMN